MVHYVFQVGEITHWQSELPSSGTSILPRAPGISEEELDLLGAILGWRLSQRTGLHLQPFSHPSGWRVPGPRGSGKGEENMGWWNDGADLLMFFFGGGWGEDSWRNWWIERKKGVCMRCMLGLFWDRVKRNSTQNQTVDSAFALQLNKGALLTFKALKQRSKSSLLLGCCWNLGRMPWTGGISCLWLGICTTHSICLHLIWDIWLGGGFKFFLFSPLVGEMIQFD